MKNERFIPERTIKYASLIYRVIDIPDVPVTHITSEIGTAQNIWQIQQARRIENIFGVLLQSGYNPTEARLAAIYVVTNPQALERR